MWPILTDRVEWSVGLSVCHSREPCKNDRTDRDADWVVGLRELKELCIRWGPDPPMARDNFWREKGRPIAKYRDTLRWSVQKRLNRSRCRLGCTVVGSDGPKEACVTCGYTLANTIKPSVYGGDVYFWFTAKWPLFSYIVSVCLSVCLCRVFLSRLWSDRFRSN